MRLRRRSFKRIFYWNQRQFNPATSGKIHTDFLICFHRIKSRLPKDFTNRIIITKENDSLRSILILDKNCYIKLCLTHRLCKAKSEAIFYFFFFPARNGLSSNMLFSKPHVYPELQNVFFEKVTIRSCQ